MAEEIEIELDEFEAAPCQWVLSCGDLRHIGYVQKRTGFIQLIQRVDANVKQSIKEQVERRLDKTDLPVGEVPDISKLLEEDAE